MRKAVRLKPQVTGGKIESVEIGRVWTRITIKLSTRRFALQASRAAYGKDAKPWLKA